MKSTFENPYSLAWAKGPDSILEDYVKERQNKNS